MMIKPTPLTQEEREKIEKSNRQIEQLSERMMKTEKTCACCFVEYTGYGNNPYPLIERGGAKCCDDCNEFVFITRVGMAYPTTENPILNKSVWINKCLKKRTETIMSTATPRR